MIDTIVLTLPPTHYQIIDPDLFTPSARFVLNHPSQKYNGIKALQNPTKKELLQGIYKPRLTLAYTRISKTAVEPTLKIELSLPKLMFGNNFQELSYKDFNPIITKLATTLTSMGVHVKEEQLINANVAAIHYSKNIMLTDGSTPYHYINKIKDADVKRSLDTNQTDYRNEGHSYKWHCNSYEVVFYDKIKDLEQAKISAKRSLEKDNYVQLHLFEKFKKRHKLEFLRMEVRLNKRTKMKQLFKALKINTDLTFKKLFKPAIAKKVLLHYLDELEAQSAPLLQYKMGDDKTFLAHLAINNSDLKPKEAMMFFGFKKALETSMLRELKTMFGKNNPGSWRRLIKSIENIKLPIKQNSFAVLREQLIRFKTLKII